MHMKGLTLSAILEQGTTRRRKSPPKEECPKKQKRDSWRKIAAVLNKCENKRTCEELRLLESEPEVVKQILERRKRNEEYKERVLETEDEPEVIERKALKLAQAIAKANHLIVYTGAGVSTSAKIPDYRGSNGIWTLLEKGKDIGEHDLSLADPTFTHMALFELHQRGILKHVLSQNCDGLHLRSGLPRFSLSEVHGNMYVEVCKQCKPSVEYWRLFDTTQFTARHYHRTNRRCRTCGGPLVDTIVHFGERGQLRWPLNWAGVTPHTEKTDLILCIGSSLKVLRKYTWLWATDRPIKKRPKIFIINLQWTPKDKVSTLKINGRCDEVMKLVMKHLNMEVPLYNRLKDPIFAHATLLLPEEQHTASQPMLRKTGDTKEESTESSPTTELAVKTESTIKVESEIKTETSVFPGTSAQQMYLNNLFAQQQQMNSNYNFMLKSITQGLKSHEPIPPLVPCSNSSIYSDQVNVEAGNSTVAAAANSRYSGSVNIIKADTASNLFGNLRQVLNTINLTTLNNSVATGDTIDSNISAPEDERKDLSNGRTDATCKSQIPMPLFVPTGVTVVQKPFLPRNATEKSMLSGEPGSKLPQCNKIQLIVKPVVVSNPPSLVPIQQYRRQVETVELNAVDRKEVFSSVSLLYHTRGGMAMGDPTSDCKTIPEQHIPDITNESLQKTAYDKVAKMNNRSQRELREIETVDEVKHSDEPLVCQTNSSTSSCEANLPQKASHGVQKLVPNEKQVYKTLELKGENISADQHQQHPKNHPSPDGIDYTGPYKGTEHMEETKNITTRDRYSVLKNSVESTSRNSLTDCKEVPNQQNFADQVPCNSEKYDLKNRIANIDDGGRIEANFKERNPQSGCGKMEQVAYKEWQHTIDEQVQHGIIMVTDKTASGEIIFKRDLSMDGTTVTREQLRNGPNSDKQPSTEIECLIANEADVHIETVNELDSVKPSVGNEKRIRDETCNDLGLDGCTWNQRKTAIEFERDQSEIHSESVTLKQTVIDLGNEYSWRKHDINEQFRDERNNTNEVCIEGECIQKKADKTRLEHSGQDVSDGNKDHIELGDEINGSIFDKNTITKGLTKKDRESVLGSLQNHDQSDAAVPLGSISEDSRNIKLNERDVLNCVQRTEPFKQEYPQVSKKCCIIEGFTEVVDRAAVNNNHKDQFTLDGKCESSQIAGQINTGKTISSGENDCSRDENLATGLFPVFGNQHGKCCVENIENYCLPSPVSEVCKDTVSNKSIFLFTEENGTKNETQRINVENPQTETQCQEPNSLCSSAKTNNPKQSNGNQHHSPLHDACDEEKFNNAALACTNFESGNVATNENVATKHENCLSRCSEQQEPEVAVKRGVSLPHNERVDLMVEDKKSFSTKSKSSLLDRWSSSQSTSRDEDEEIDGFSNNKCLTSYEQRTKADSKIRPSHESRKMVKVVLSNSILIELYEAKTKFDDGHPPALKLIGPIKYQIAGQLATKIKKPISPVLKRPSNDNMLGATIDLTTVTDEMLSTSEVQSPRSVPQTVVSPSGIRKFPLQPTLLITPSGNTCSNGFIDPGTNGFAGVIGMGLIQQLNPSVPPFIPLQGGLAPNGAMAAYILKNNNLVPTNQTYPNLFGFPTGMAANLILLTSPPKKQTCSNQPLQTSESVGALFHSDPTTPVTSAKYFHHESDEHSERRSQKRRSKRLESVRINKQLATPEKSDSDTDATINQSSLERRRRRGICLLPDDSDEMGESSCGWEGRSRSFRIRRKPEFLNIKHPVKKKKRLNDKPSSPKASTSYQPPMTTNIASETHIPGSSVSAPPASRAPISTPISYLSGTFVSPIGGSTSTMLSPQDNYKRILTYCKAAMQQQTNTVNTGHSLPQWYDVNYAYSGLHSIIHPPPPDANLWGASSIKLQTTPQPLVIECKFCFENYSQYCCQFYLPQPAEFTVKSVHRGKVVVCECCDFSDGEYERSNTELDREMKLQVASSSKDALGAVAPEQKREGLVVEEALNESTIIPGPTRSKGEAIIAGDSPAPSIISNGALRVGHKPKVKPGWYGKGYRKHLRRKKRTSQG